jgi:hypothetical protein
LSRQALWASAQASQDLPDAAGSGDQQVLAVGDPLTACKMLEQGAVEAARGAVVDVLDHGVLAQLGAAQPCLGALGVAPGGLALDQEREALLEAEGLGLARAEQLFERLGHADEAEPMQLVEGGMSQHEGPPQW